MALSTAIFSIFFAPYIENKFTDRWSLSLSLSMWIVHVCVFVFVFEFGMQIVDTCLKSDMILNVEFRWAILEIT